MSTPARPFPPELCTTDDRARSLSEVRPISKPPCPRGIYLSITRRWQVKGRFLKNWPPRTVPFSSASLDGPGPNSLALGWIWAQTVAGIPHWQSFSFYKPPAAEGSANICLPMYLDRQAPNQRAVPARSFVFWECARRGPGAADVFIHCPTSFRPKAVQEVFPKVLHSQLRRLDGHGTPCTCSSATATSTASTKPTTLQARQGSPSQDDPTRKDQRAQN